MAAANTEFDLLFLHRPIAEANDSPSDLLSASDSNLLRSWRCHQAGPMVTGEITVHNYQIAQLNSWWPASRLGHADGRFVPARLATIKVVIREDRLPIGGTFNRRMHEQIRSVNFHLKFCIAMWPRRESGELENG